MTNPAPAETRVFDRPDELAATVAQALIEAIAEDQASGNVASICLTGGTISRAVHRALADLGAASAVDWGAVEFWWGDDRYVEATSPDRNALQADEDFLTPLGVPAHHIHPMATTGSACSVDEGAREYAALLARRGSEPFLVTMLGVGPDGHVASLFPGLAGLRSTDTVVGVSGSPKPPPYRISLTLPTLNNSTNVWLVVSGSDKAPAVAATQAGADLPAGLVQGRESTVWFLDRAAAGREA